MTEGLDYDPDNFGLREFLAQLPPEGEGMKYVRVDVHSHPEHRQPAVVQHLACPECGTEQLGPSLTGCGHPYHRTAICGVTSDSFACNLDPGHDGPHSYALPQEEYGQQTGLTQAAALARLRELGISDLAAVQAIEMAPAAEDGIVIVDGHMVSFAEGYGWAVTPRNAPQPAGEHDLAWVLRVVEIVDRHLDEAAPPLYRVLPGDSPETAEVKKVLNRFRRLAAGPASEGQEAVDQLNLLTGGNPRKGVVGTEDDVLLELGDTAVAALFAIQSITKDTMLTWQWVLAALSKALNRVPDGAVRLIDHPGEDDDFPPVMVPAGQDEAPGRPAGYCRDCWASGCGACDAFPDCPNGRAQQNV